MKVTCKQSHEIPLGEGRFLAYVAGREYDLEDPDPAFFIPVDPDPRSTKHERRSTKKKEVTTDDSDK